MIALLILLNTNKLLYDLVIGIISTRLIDKLVTYSIVIRYIGTRVLMYIGDEALWSFKGIILHRSAFHV